MLSLYIHVPFCVRKCRYCGFYSTVYDRSRADGFLKAIRNEIILRSEEMHREDFRTIYIGGGTPTIITLGQLHTLAATVLEQVRRKGIMEFTVEANPNSLSHSMLSLLREQGVNRISIGVQSFSQKILDWLGRAHTTDQADAAIEFARKSGFINISIDLIYGIPGLSEGLWRDTLQRAIDLRPTHISAYSLSVDEGSQLHREMLSGAAELPDDDTIARQNEDAVDMLGEAGYQRYEISNFCQPSFECRHNMNYWERGEYIGLGPGAWSFTGNRRRRNVADIDAYIRKLENGEAPFDFEEVLDSAQAATEELFLGMRRTSGIDLDVYAEKYGSAARQKILEQVDALSRTGLYIVGDGRLRLSRKGMLLSNDALSRIIS